MTSSTSRFERSVPRRLVLVCAVAGATWLAAAFYTLRINPDVREFTAGSRIKAEWNAKLRQHYPSNYIVFGGSSSSFSVDPQIAIDEFDFPLSNLALGAGLGSWVLTRYAASQCRSGDTLVMTMEPSLLAGALVIPQLGQQFSIASGHPEWASELNSIEPCEQPSPTVYISALRPGGAHAVLLLAKLAMGRPLYRYKIGDFLPTGQKVTEIRIPPVTHTAEVRIGPDGFAFLDKPANGLQESRCGSFTRYPGRIASPPAVPGREKTILPFSGR